MRATSIQIPISARRAIGALSLLAAALIILSTHANAQGFALSIQGPRTVCVGETAVYTAVTTLGTGFSWEVQRGTIVSGQNSNTISVEWAGGGIDSITVYAVSTSGVPATRTIGVVVSGVAKPIIEASGSTTLCPGTDVQLSAPEGFAQYQWNTGHTARTIRVEHAGTFAVTVTNAQGCSATSPPVNVTTLVGPEATITPLGPTTFCEGGSVVLDGGEGNFTYDWSNGEHTRFITVTKTGFYRVVVRDIYGCTATSPTVAVNVIPRPRKPTITRQGTTLISTPGMTYQWFRNGVAIPGATMQQYQASAGGKYTVGITNTAGCYSESDPFDFTVAAVRVYIPNLEVDLHQTLSIPLYVSVPDNIHLVSQYSFRALVRFDKNALYPQRTANVIDGDDRIVTLTGTWVPGDSLLGTIDCTPMWSDIKKTTVFIDSFTFYSDDIFVDYGMAVFSWLLCNDGGTRLFLDDEPMGLQQNHPNPFNATTNFEYTIIEEGRTSLSIYDMLGRKVATVFDADIPPGTYRVPFEASALSSGIYMYVLQTPSDRDVKFMELVK